MVTGKLFANKSSLVRISNKITVQHHGYFGYFKIHEECLLCVSSRMLSRSGASLQNMKFRAQIRTKRTVVYCKVLQCVAVFCSAMSSM